MVSNNLRSHAAHLLGNPKREGHRIDVLDSVRQPRVWLAEWVNKSHALQHRHVIAQGCVVPATSTAKYMSVRWRLRFQFRVRSSKTQAACANSKKKKRKKPVEVRVFLTINTEQNSVFSWLWEALNFYHLLRPYYITFLTETWSKQITMAAILSIASLFKVTDLVDYIRRFDYSRVSPRPKKIIPCNLLNSDLVN